MEVSKWSGYTRHIEEIWRDNTINKKMELDPIPENSHVFLCGNPFMIDSMIEETTKDGFSEYSEQDLKGQLHFEKF